MAQQPAAITLLRQTLEDLGAASDTARLQLHLLALEARQRSGELGTGIDNLEQRIDRSVHQALANAADKARHLTKTVQEALRGTSPAAASGPGRIGSIMAEPVHTCSPEDSLARAAQIMWDGDCGAVPVLDAEARPCGMLTDRDICMATYTKGTPLHAIRVADVMSRHVHSCSVADPLERAIAVMAEAQVRRVPVIDPHGRLVGIISLGDVARAAALLGQREAEQLIYQLLGAVSKRRSSGARGQAIAAE